MEDLGPRKRGSTLPVYDDHSYVPDFLQDSPFFPVGLRYDDAPRVPYRKPSLRQVLKSKTVRATFTTIIAVIAAFLLLRSVRRAIIKQWFSGPACLRNQLFVPTQYYLHEEGIDWSQYAYAQYATNTEYLCNSIMIFESLQRLGSKAERLLMYSETFDEDPSSAEYQLLQKAKNKYGVNLVPIQVQHKKAAFYLWADSYTKLLAFNQTQYKRLLVLDSDSTILQPMDELFFIPPTTAALTRAYWLDAQLGSHIMLIQPSEQESARVQKAIKRASGTVYDMEIVNELFGDSCVLLPHQRYGLLTGEYRRQTHERFLEQNERWDPEKVIREAKFVHFSDDPFPKPWVPTTGNMVERMKPVCAMTQPGTKDCRARDIWLELYRDFKERRKDICRLEAPLTAS